MTKQTIE